MFDFFARHAVPADSYVRDIEFVTVNPGISAWSHWAGIEAQISPLKPSSIHIRYDPGHRRFRGTTDNVATLSLRLQDVPPGKPLTVELDEQKLNDIGWQAGTAQIWLVRAGGQWTLSPPPGPSRKGSQRNGPFKEAFRNRILLVYGTHGTPDENAWAFAKARYDAEQFWYRGNGSLSLLPDDRFDAASEPDRDVILYGNAQSNSAWSRLLTDSPVQVSRGSIRVGQREEKGDDLACLFLRPRPGSARACVGVITGTGVIGMRLTDRLTYFSSGVAYPDYVVLGPDVLVQGVAGIRVAGFFGLDWGVEFGEAAWR